MKKVDKRDFRTFVVFYLVGSIIGAVVTSIVLGLSL